MDQVVQRNAANSEESAGASQELNSQAALMKGLVDDLVSVIGGLDQRKGDHQARLDIVPKAPLLPQAKNNLNLFALQKPDKGEPSSF